MVFQFGVDIIALYVANSVIRCAPMADQLFPDLAYFAALIRERMGWRGGGDVRGGWGWRGGERG